MTQQEHLHSIASACIKGIVEDLTDRRGLKGEWYNIDDETIREIMDEWEDIIFTKLLKELT